jgi:two-component system, OmpR family, alkaline phosphatase synthesis response regulator PhoP
MPNERVLVVDDEADILRLVEYNLVRNGCRVSCVSSGEAALAAAREAPPDLVLLDLMLPGVDGFAVCRALKADPRTAAVPVVILSARGEESDVVAALELGADDYVTKPLSPRVLVARVRAVLRRRAEPAPAEEVPLEVQGVTLDPGRRTVSVGGKAVELTNTEFRLLHMLARRPGWVFTRNQIIDAVRGTEAAVTDRSVDVHVAGLRRKLGAAGRHIETIRGVGYRLEE